MAPIVVNTSNFLEDFGKALLMLIQTHWQKLELIIITIRQISKNMKLHAIKRG